MPVMTVKYFPYMILIKV